MQLHAGGCTQPDAQLLGRIGRCGRRLNEARDGRVWAPLYWKAFVLIFLSEQPARAHVDVIPDIMLRMRQVGE